MSKTIVSNGSLVVYISLDDNTEIQAYYDEEQEVCVIELETAKCNDIRRFCMDFDDVEDLLYLLFNNTTTVELNLYFYDNDKKKLEFDSMSHGHLTASDTETNYHRTWAHYVAENWIRLCINVF